MPARPCCQPPPPDHPSTPPLPTRQPSVRHNSIFFRRPRPVSRPLVADCADECSCQNSSCHNGGYEPGCDDDGDDDDDDEGSVFDDGGVAAAADAAADEAAQRHAACQELPFSHCFFTPDTHEFLWSTAPAIVERPLTVKAPPFDFGSMTSKYHPPTPEIVMSIAETLRMCHRNDICLALVPYERRLPELRDFIWRLFDGTRADMWTAISCLLLLRRFRCTQPPREDSPYEAPYSLFLGVFMAAAIHCERTIEPELLQPASIAQILDTWYQKADLIAILHDTLTKLDHRAWIRLTDVENHAKNNVFDVYLINSSYQHYELRQRQRMMLVENERRWEEDRQRLQAQLERFMYRSPHDSLCSWNTKIMYSTEDRFLFRHLPWSPGANAPIHVTARSEEVRQYLEDDRLPVFSPLLPALRPTVPSSTN